MPNTRMTLKVRLALLAGAFTLASASGADGAAFRVERDIVYSSVSTQCVLDVRSPIGASNCAVVVNFHGGGLTGGNKCFGPWPAEGVNADAVVRVGVRYRLMKAGSDAVKPQDCIADAAAATAWTIRNIARFGGDPKKVFLTGVSAGGYLTGMVGLDAKWLAPHGLKPADLAGIVPLTGQMTKHFNVRKIGFRDDDPQFLPKIDAWAPLFYAGRPDLPPACFCTGGRDVEWKGRVEENELLARALRDCGHRAVEFHETEGDHSGGVQESAYCLRDFVMSRAEADGVARFADGERVVFFGDSITHGGRYVFYLQLFQNLRRPGSGTRILNGGISGDTAAGGVARWRHDVLPMKPARVFVMFGMNDVGRNNYATGTPTAAQAKARADALGRYEASQRRLAELFDAAGVKAVFMTPSPYDQYSPMPGRENLVACNEPGLAACARIVRTLAAERHAGLVDLHAPLTTLFRNHPDHPFCGDRVHPGPDGHLIMAAHILETMRYSPVVARAVVDAAAGRALRIGRGLARNCAVTDVTRAPGRIAFTYAPKALPFPKLPEYVAVDGVFHPLTELLNQELLVVQGLPAGRHTLRFDGRTVGSFTAAEFARGVNVALLETPNQLRARETAKVMVELQARVSALRRRAPEKAVLDAEAEDLYERMAAVRPAVSRVSVELEAK